MTPTADPAATPPHQTDAAAFFADWSDRMTHAKAQAPDIGRGFAPFFQALMRDGGPDGLSVRDKELIALGIGLALRCAPCIRLHVEKCLKAGATRRQILDAAGVAVMMQGGPTYTYLPEVVEAIEALQGESGSPPLTGR